MEETNLNEVYLKKIFQNDFTNGCQKVRLACPYCSHQRKKEWKKKSKCASIMPSTKCAHDWVFHCCHCGLTKNFPNYLKEQHPQLFRKYHLERDQQGSTGKGFNLERFQGSQDYQPKFGG
jgi:hypothetical protein